MNKYQDENGGYHDKPTKNGKPSSNNFYIYTAMAQKVGLEIDMEKVKPFFDQCVVKLSNKEIEINRLPNKVAPPLSIDEVLGMYCLGLLPYSTLKANHFVYNGKGKPLSGKVIEDFVKGILELAVITMIKGKSHRNDFWRKKIVKMYQVAFRVPPHVQYFIKKCEKANINKEDKLCWDLYKAVTLDKGSAGEINFLWLMAVHMGDRKLASKCNPKKNLTKYFGKDHDIVKAIK